MYALRSSIGSTLTSKETDSEDLFGICHAQGVRQVLAAHWGELAGCRISEDCIVTKLGIVLIVVACLGLGESPLQSVPVQSQPKEDKREKQLESERKKLDRTKDPAARTESLVKISEITLTYVTETAKASDFSAMELYLGQYRKAMSDARDTMMSSGLDPYKKPKGYKTVELAVRKHLRTLEDTARILGLEQRKPVEETIDTVSKIRDEFLRALFR